MVRFRSLPLSRVEVRSYRSARASGAPLLCSVPTDLLHPSVFMGDPGSVPGGTEGPESHIAPRHDGTAHDTMLEENSLLRNTQHALSSLLPLRLTETYL